MPTMSNPNLKLGRAKVHLDSLHVEIARFKKLNPHRISSHDDLEAGKHIVLIEVTEDIPDDIGLIAGDFISSLRASLDYLAWQLAMLTTYPPFKGTCFPICDTYDSRGGTEGYICSVTKDIPTEAVAIMRELQPYASGSGYQSTHLWRLNRLWNIEKHRRIPINGLITDEVLWVPTGIEIESTEIDNGNAIAIPLAAKDKVRFDPNPTIDLRFGSEDEGVLVTADDLLEIYEFVSNKVVPRFKGFFPKGEARGTGFLIKA